MVLLKKNGFPSPEAKGEHVPVITPVDEFFARGFLHLAL